MGIAKCFVAISVYVAGAVLIALVQGCAAATPPYSSEAPAPVTASAPALAPAPASAAVARGVVAETAEPPAAGNGERPLGVTGVWHGQIRANCNVVMMADVTRCGAVNPITLTLLQKENNVSGYYRCAYGNMNCYNMNQTGKIATGSMGSKLLKLRVMMPDGSDCLFNGWPAGDAMRGSYSCLQGGGLLEQGLWKASRSY